MTLPPIFVSCMYDNMRINNQIRSKLVESLLDDTHITHLAVNLMDRYISSRKTKRYSETKLKEILSCCLVIAGRVNSIDIPQESKRLESRILKKLCYDVCHLTLPLLLRYQGLDNYQECLEIANKMVIDGSYFIHDLEDLAKEIPSMCYEKSDCKYMTLHVLPHKITLLDKSVSSQKTRVLCGEGSFGAVFKQLYHNEEIAVKYVKSLDSVIEGYMLREISILARLDHPNVVKMIGARYERSRLAIGMELMNKSVYECVTQHRLDDDTKLKLSIQLLRGLSYLHERSIMHRDLTSNNCMITLNGDLKIVDFGAARQYHTSDHYSTDICAAYFRSLELFLGKSDYNLSTDIWSVACIIGFIYQGTYLFSHRDYNMIPETIYSKLGTPPFGSVIRSYPEYLDHGTIHPFRGFKSLDDRYPKQAMILYKMLAYDPSKRITAKGALDLFSNL